MTTPAKTNIETLNIDARGIGHAKPKWDSLDSIGDGGEMWEALPKSAESSFGPELEACRKKTLPTQVNSGPTEANVSGSCALADPNPPDILGNVLEQWQPWARGFTTTTTSSSSFPEVWNLGSDH
ncbi:hypothetical protein NOR_03704 [Metarhizium rileyi]|uniref:Uncharacterized protein n=1 Tax=Metarhizium rileyi (strain RCEF 4871) TaxID=1649241 RepID=A0A162LUK4_METRR|nr:hypothetical protein NOR_03704 [Metarhizium rileyi RCEF 4871]